MPEKRPPHAVEGPVHGPEDIDHAGTGGPYGHTVPATHAPDEDDPHIVFVGRTDDNYRNGLVAGELRDWIEENIQGRVTCDAGRHAPRGMLRFAFDDVREAAAFARRWRSPPAER